MKTCSKWIAVSALIGFLGVGTGLAQGGPKGGGWGPGSQYGRLYNPQTVETISGQVVKVERMTPMRGMGRGVHLQVKTEQGTLPVHLGPEWFIDNQEIELRPKDQVQIKGSRVTLDGKEVLIASEVKEGEDVLKLRDDNGIPLWSAWRRGPAGGAAGPGAMMRGRGPMGREMTEQRREMMREHRKMLEEMKAMDVRLGQKVEEMNQAQGTAKVDAMAEVLNELVEQRETMHQKMAAMQQRMMAHMEQIQQGRGGAESGGGTDSSGESQSEKSQE